MVMVRKQGDSRVSHRKLARMISNSDTISGFATNSWYSPDIIYDPQTKQVSFSVPTKQQNIN